MNNERIKSIVFDMLESCDCDDRRICEKCPFINLCVGLFTGDWGELPSTETEKENEENGKNG